MNFRKIVFGVIVALAPWTGALSNVRPANAPKVYKDRPQADAEEQQLVLLPPVQLAQSGHSPVFDAEYERERAAYEAEIAAMLRARIDFLKKHRRKGMEGEFGGNFDKLRASQEIRVESLKAKKIRLERMRREKAARTEPKDQ